MSTLTKIISLTTILITTLSSVATLTADGRMKIGVLIPLSGEVAQFGDVVRRGIEQVPHPGIEFVYEDTACQAGKALSA